MVTVMVVLVVMMVIMIRYVRTEDNYYVTASRQTDIF